MESFQNLKTYLRRIGILQWSSDPKTKILVSLWNCFLFTIFVCYFLAALWHVLSTGRTFKDYAEISIYLCSSLLLGLWYAICVWQRDEYAALFLDLGRKMEKRKL